MQIKKKSNQREAGRKPSPVSRWFLAWLIHEDGGDRFLRNVG
jgi:hypothetical protein